MRRLRDEEGFAAVVAALILLMLFGFAGFAVDAGAMWQERRELRNGADAAALAVAEDCITGAAACTDAVGLATAEDYADSNADDGRSGVDSVVIDLMPPNPDYTVTVRVVTSSEDETGDPGFDFTFMKLLGNDSTMVRADATAAAGPLGMGGGLPLVISTCEWYRGPEGPPEVPQEWDFFDEIILWWHDGDTQEPCNNPAGQDVPGGFGWLETLPGTCETQFEQIGDEWWANAGTGVVPTCTKEQVAALLQPGPDGTPATIIVPYFDLREGTGSNARFRIVGFGAFTVTGYDLQPGSQFEWNSPCPIPNDQVCMGGWFERGVTLSEGEFGGEDFGVYLVRLIE
jgi:hypothetical protein